ncbi:MAG: serine/threonine protein kinase [Phycisphaera sp.]|nr:MAG: serine/threonine protein kinase [Phycisphaera sp.]
MGDTDRFQEVDRLFQAVCDLPADQVSDRLIELAPNDESLRSEVIELLRAEADSGRDISPEAFQSSIQKVLTESVNEPDQVGNYSLIRRLGQGGMGVVYEARQRSPERTVALKLLKPGLASPELIRRFEFETKALGRLQHPGIAHIYEAGVSESVMGPRPYFAMELVEGISLSEWVRKEQPDVRQTLELVAKICDAVQHAHSKGVVHRDLKPTNILVTSDGVPKVLDFGVARTVEDESQDAESIYTRPGQLMGTMPYMSPEQIGSDPDGVDTRSDVYSLGVILYELLSGELPSKVEGLGLVDAAREIQDKQAAKLSTYNTRYRGDIETIVSTALAKDKQDRYQTIAALADDIRRYLANETISARPPSAVYQLSRFAKRNKLLVGVSCALVVAMIAAVIGTSYGIVIANEQTNLAEDSLEEAQRQQKISESVTSFFNNDVLASVVPSAQGHKVTVIEALDRAAESLGERFLDEPATKAAISNNIGNVYLVLGEFAKAEPLIRDAIPLFTESLGENHELTHWAQRDLAMLLKDTGRFDEALLVLEPLLQSMEALEKPASEVQLNVIMTTAEAKAGMGDYQSCSELLNLYEERRQGVLEDSDNRVLSALMNSGHLDLELGRPADALVKYRKVYETRVEMDGAEAQGTLIAEHNVATGLEALGRYDEALSHYVHVYEVSREKSGPDNPDILVTAHNLAFLYQSMGRFDEAEPLYRDTLERCHKVFGPVHPGTMTCTGSLASLLRETERNDEAAELLGDAYAKAKQADTGSSALTELEAKYATILTELDRLEEAAALFANCVPQMEQMYQGPHPALAGSLRSWGKCLEADGNSEAAVVKLTQAYEMSCELGDTESASKAASDIAGIYERVGDGENRRVWLEHAENPTGQSPVSSDGVQRPEPNSTEK